MDEILSRLDSLEHQVNNIKLVLSEIVQQSSENEKQNLEGYKKLAQAINILSEELNKRFTTDIIK